MRLPAGECFGLVPGVGLGSFCGYSVRDSLRRGRTHIQENFYRCETLGVDCKSHLLKRKRKTHDKTLGGDFGKRVLPKGGGTSKTLCTACVSYFPHSGRHERSLELDLKRATSHQIGGGREW